MTNRVSRMLLRLFLITVLFIGGASCARPVLDHASPAAGSTLPHTPSQVALSFTEALLPSDSDAVVRNATGGVVSSGKARITGNKGEMQVPVNSLSPGKYRVEWYATSVDRHSNEGSFNFMVGDNLPRRAGSTGKGSSNYAFAPQSRAAVHRYRKVSSTSDRDGTKLPKFSRSPLKGDELSN
jgi:copper resistance protein C